MTKNWPEPKEAVFSPLQLFIMFYLNTIPALIWIIAMLICSIFALLLNAQNPIILKILACSLTALNQGNRSTSDNSYIPT